MNNTIAVLGCGWLGIPLAKALINLGYIVHGSTRSQGKIRQLEADGIIPFVIQLNETKTEGNVEAFLKNCNTVIINIPPGLRQNPESNYVSKIKSFVNYLANSCVSKILFVSSTSVFQDTANIDNYNESSSPNAKSDAGIQLVKTEQLLLDLPFVDTKIIRFGGLIGKNRHPAVFLSDKPLKNPEAPINLIDLDDCVGLLIKILNSKSEQKIFHGVNQCHPLKKDYYKKVCMAKNIAPPLILNKASKGKIIESGNTLKTLDYNYTINL